jgi:hypothetical protein
MGGLTQGFKTRKNLNLLCKSNEKVSKTHSIKHDDECNKFKTNISAYGNNNWSVTVSTNNLFKVCHQNIRGLLGKTEELLSSLLFDPPHIMCLTEHHLKDFEVNSILIGNYELGAKYCRKLLKMEEYVFLFMTRLNSVKFQ